MSNNINKLRNNLKDGEAMLVTGRHRLRYLSGFSGEGSIIITPSDALLITDFRYMTDAKKAWDNFGLEVKDISIGIENLMPEGIKKLYIEETMPYGTYLYYCDKFRDIEIANNVLIDGLRKIKTNAEIENISHAAGIADRAFEEVLDSIKIGVSERDIAAKIEYLMKKLGADGISFDTIVASGENSAIPHAVPGDRKIKSGDFVTLDFGCIYNGYCSDMTRTVVMGEASDKHIEVYELVLKAQLAALDAVTAHALCKDIDSVARNTITGAGYGENFGHALGHGVGLLVHEEPRLSQKCTEPLKENMVVTVEPGIYIEGFGGVRIEDLVVVTQDKPTILTKTKKDLLIL